MRTFRRTALSLLLVLAAARAKAGGWSLDLMPSYDQPVQASAEVFKPSPGVMADLEYGFSPSFALGADFAYDLGYHMEGVSYTHTLGYPVRFTSDIDAPMFSAVAVAKFRQHLSILGREVEVTESGGGGLFNLWTTAGDLVLEGRAPDGTDVSGTRVSLPATSNKYFGSVWGLGLEVPLPGSLSLGASLRYERVYEHDDDAFLMGSLRLGLAL